MWSGSSRMTVWSCWSDAAYTRSTIRVGGGRRPAPHVGRWLAANLDSVERDVEICCDEVPGVPSPPGSLARLLCRSDHYTPSLHPARITVITAPRGALAASQFGRVHTERRMSRLACRCWIWSPVSRTCAGCHCRRLGAGRRRRVGIGIEAPRPPAIREPTYGLTRNVDTGWLWLVPSRHPLPGHEGNLRRPSRPG
jgi:hypothetical protein